jgi:hypothetical protein
MQRSGSREVSLRCPGFRFTPSGLRWLDLVGGFAEQQSVCVLGVEVSLMTDPFRLPGTRTLRADFGTRPNT